MRIWPGEEGRGGGEMMWACKGGRNGDDDPMDSPESMEARSSPPGEAGVALSKARARASSVSRRERAAAIPRRTARIRSGRSKMCDELGWRIYLCCKHAGWMQRASGKTGAIVVVVQWRRKKA